MAYNNSNPYSGATGEGDFSNYFHKDPWASQMQMLSGGSLGNPMMDLLASMATGGGMLSRPGSGQSVYDAFRFRERSREFREAMRSGVTFNPAVQAAGGFGQNPFGQMAQSMMAPPDSILNKLSGFYGGNPVRAQMGLFAGMTGTNNAVFGRLGNASVYDTNQMMEGFQGNFWNTRNKSQQGEYLNNEKNRINSDPNMTKELAEALLKKVNSDIASLSKADPNSKYLAGINYANTRGFKVEDITQAFTSAAGYQLFDGRHMDMRTAASKFSGNVGVLDAARTTFGTGDMSKLMPMLNEFIGKGKVNLTDEKSAGEVEDRLRKFQSLSKTVGVSIDALLTMNKEMQDMFNAHPQLNSVSGADINNMSTNSVRMAAHMATFMDTTRVRDAGGIPGMARELKSSDAQRLLDPISQQFAGQYYYLQMNGQTEAAEKLLAYASDGTSKTLAGANDFRQGLASKYGLNQSQFFGAGHSKEFSKRGMAWTTAFGGMSDSLVLGNFEKDIAQQYSSEGNRAALSKLSGRNIGSSEDAVKYMHSLLDGGTVDSTELGARMGLTGEYWERYTSRGRQLQQTAINNSKGYKDLIKLDDAYRLQGKTDDAALAYTKDSTLGNLVNSLVDGSLGSDPLSAMRKIFAQPQYANSKFAGIMSNASGLMNSANASRNKNGVMSDDAINKAVNGMMGGKHAFNAASFFGVTESEGLSKDDLMAMMSADDDGSTHAALRDKYKGKYDSVFGAAQQFWDATNTGDAATTDALRSGKEKITRKSFSDSGMGDIYKAKMNASKAAAIMSEEQSKLHDTYKAYAGDTTLSDGKGGDFSLDKVSDVLEKYKKDANAPDRENKIHDLSTIKSRLTSAQDAGHIVNPSSPDDLFKQLKKLLEDSFEKIIQPLVDLVNVAKNS